MTIADRLTMKVGPLPAIAWAGIAGGAYVVYAYATREPATSSAGESAPLMDTFPGGVGEADDFTYGYGNATGAYNVNAGTVTVTDPDEGIADTFTWAQRTINYLISNGYSVLDATTAIWNYLNDSTENLTGTQMAAWQLAIKKFGLPPGSEGLPPPTVAPSTTTPTNPPTTKPPTTTPNKTQYKGHLEFSTLSATGVWRKATWDTIWYDSKAMATMRAEAHKASLLAAGKKNVVITYPTRVVPV